jgi:ankyrin repeat protein
LIAAAHGGDPQTVRFLIERGADVRARTKSGYTALYAGTDPNVRMEITQPIEDVFTPSQGAGRR